MPKSPKSSIARNAKKLVRFLAEKKTEISPLLIMTHDYPDPDALASAVALQYLAEKIGAIPSSIVYGGVIGRMENKRLVGVLRLPVHKLKSHDLRNAQHIALVDTQPGFENNPFPNNRRAVLVLDQHPSIRRPEADLAIVDTTCGATSVILAAAMLMLGPEIPGRIATALAYGILSDTLNLYRARNMQVIKTYLDVLRFCDMRALAEIQNPERSRKFFSTLSRAIQKAMVRRGLIVSHLGEVESPDLVAQMADFFLTYKGMKWSFVTGRYQGRLYVSLRIDNLNLEAGEILRDVVVNRDDAGGHGAVAGGSIRLGGDLQDETWRQVETELTTRLLGRLRISQKGEFYFPFKIK